MAKLNLEQAMIQAAQCVRKYKHLSRSAEILVFTESLDVRFRTADVVREFPKDGDELRVWAENGDVVMAVSFNFEEEEG